MNDDDDGGHRPVLPDLSNPQPSVRPEAEAEHFDLSAPQPSVLRPEVGVDRTQPGSPESMKDLNADGVDGHDMEMGIVGNLFSAVASRAPVVDRVDGARHAWHASGSGRNWTDREGQHRKQIMGKGRIVQRASDSRTDDPVVPKAATARETSRPRLAFDGERGSTTCVTGPPIAHDCEYPGRGGFCDPAFLRRDAGNDEQIDKAHDLDLRDIARLYDVVERSDARESHSYVLSLISSLGGDSRRYHRVRARAARAIVSEVYSPPRVSDLARRMPRYGLAPGFALDLTTTDDNGVPWDFTKKSHRDRAEALLEEQRPMLLIGSPVCTAFSSWQFINGPKRPADIVAEEKRVGRIHVDWCMRLYAKQMDRGGYFLHEHPSIATSWDLDSVKGMLARSGVGRIVADQCQHGQETEAGHPIKKPTGFMSNSADLMQSLDKRCLGKRG